MAESTSNYIKEIQRRRMLSGDKSSFAKTAGEISVFVRYGKTPNINNLHANGPRIDIGAEDDDGRTVLIVDSQKGKNEWIVDCSLIYDVYVFINAISSSSCDIVGWMTYTEIQEAPIRDNMYVVESEHFFKMPSEFNFTSPCGKSKCDYSAIWDWDTDSWDCFGSCGKHRYDREGSEWWPRYRDEQRNKVPEAQEGN